jgi:hypothetical protein
MQARYELRVAGWLSDRARRAFGGRATPVRPQTSICAELDDRTQLRDLIELCSGMGLELVSVRRLTDRDDPGVGDIDARDTTDEDTPRDGP